ncbi:MAG: ribosome-associated translation inhibitor RaiA [Chloroflexota bacterium]|nr:ribosome-associated translation inhibitor RaiA [Chloroflexota bacterium]
MRTIVKGKNLEVPAADRRYAQDKLRRLERLLDDRTDALVELSVENVRSPQASQVVDVTLVIDGRPVRGTARAATHRAAIDDVVDKLERQAVDHKRRPLLKRKSRAQPTVAAQAEEAEPDDSEPQRPAVVKLKRFAIEPMFEEDAMARMEELGHSFFVFVNAENERLAVLYRRRDGAYGLIEPQLGGAYTASREEATRRAGAGRTRRLSGS